MKTRAGGRRWSLVYAFIEAGWPSARRLLYQLRSSYNEPRKKLARFKAELESASPKWSASSHERSRRITGEAIAAPLEHTVRIHFLDHLLKALGWKMEAVVEEARVKQDTTLFLDYLGVHLQQRIPILIFEAKAWDKRW